MIDPYVILVMPFNFILSSNLSFVLSKNPVFAMAMPPKNRAANAFENRQTQREVEPLPSHRTTIAAPPSE